jgi:hypothetical protein
VTLYVPYSVISSARSQVKMYVSIVASGELFDSGQLKLKYTYALGAWISIPRLYHSFDRLVFRIITGCPLCSRERNKKSKK